MMTDTEKRRPETATVAALPDALVLIRETLGKLKYGAIQLTIHEGRVV